MTILSNLFDIRIFLGNIYVMCADVCAKLIFLRRVCNVYAFKVKIATSFGQGVQSYTCIACIIVIDAFE